MASIVAWPITILITVIIGAILWVLQRFVAKAALPAWLQPIDAATVVAWWSIQSISYQVWGHSFLLPLLLMLVLWGIALAFYQTFLKQTFTLQRFGRQWFRIINITTFAVLVILALLGWLL